MKYQPTQVEVRWLRRWKETGCQLVGEASVNTQAEFKVMQEKNVRTFKEWAAVVAAGLEVNAAPAESPTAKRGRKPKMQVLDNPTPDVFRPDIDITNGDPDELFTRENQEDEI